MAIKERRSINITNAQRKAMIGVKYNGVAFFNPVIDENGIWQISEDCARRITNPDWFFLKDRLSHEYKNIHEATDLSKCLTSENLDNEDLNKIYRDLNEHNSLVNPIIRPDRIHSTDLEAKNALMEKGIILVDDE